MKTNADGTVTPSEVVIAATQTAHLQPFALIGIFGSPETPGALIRNPDGKITRVTVGDAAPGGRVSAIGADRVVITKRGRNTVFKLPQV